MNNPLEASVSSSSIKTPSRFTLQTPSMLVVVLVGALASCVSLYFVYLSVPELRNFARPVKMRVTNLFQPAELRGADFVVSDGNGTKLLSYDKGVLSGQGIPGVLVSQDSHEQATAQIILAEGGEYQVVIDGKVATSSPAPKVGIARSAGGRYVAYAEAAQGSFFQIPRVDFIPMLTIEPKNWNMMILDSQTGKVTRIALGTTPFFLNEGNLGYFAPEGIYAFNIETGVIDHLITRPIKKVSVSALVSPNHELVALQDSSTAFMQIYRVQADAVTVKEVAHFEVAYGAASYVLGNDSLYMAQLVDQKPEVWQQKFTKTGAHSVLVLPATLHSVRFTLGSL